MITQGSRITVMPSDELTELKLNGMPGETGVVLEVLTGPERKVPGYMVLFPCSYRGEYVWFIPQESAYEQD